MLHDIFAQAVRVLNPPTPTTVPATVDEARDLSLAHLSRVGVARGASLLCVELDRAGVRLDHPQARVLMQRLLAVYFDTLQGVR